MSRMVELVVNTWRGLGGAGLRSASLCLHLDQLCWSKATADTDLQLLISAGMHTHTHLVLAVVAPPGRALVHQHGVVHPELQPPANQHGSERVREGAWMISPPHTCKLGRP